MFMKPVIQFSLYWSTRDAGGDVGVHVIHADPDEHEKHIPESLDDLRHDLDDEEIVEAELVLGWVGRLSADGYLDATEWTTGDSARDVARELRSMYCTDEDEDEVAEYDDLDHWAEGAKRTSQVLVYVDEHSVKVTAGTPEK